MPLGMEVGLSPDDLVLDEDPARPPLKRGTPHLPTMSIVANGWMYQDATWYGGKASAQATLLDEDPDPPQKRSTAPQLSAHVCRGQTVAHLSYC